MPPIGGATATIRETCLHLAMGIPLAPATVLLTAASTTRPPRPAPQRCGLRGGRGIRAQRGSRWRDRDAPDEGRAGVGRWGRAPPDSAEAATTAAPLLLERSGSDQTAFDNAARLSTSGLVHDRAGCQRFSVLRTALVDFCGCAPTREHITIETTLRMRRRRSDGSSSRCWDRSELVRGVRDDLPSMAAVYPIGA